MTNKDVIRTFKKPLIWVSIISILVIVIMGLIINSQSKQISYVYENYQYKCGEGFKSQCIESDKEMFTCDKGEYNVCIGKDETYTVCDTDRREMAICINEGVSWTQCKDNEWAHCIGNGISWTSCPTGEQARCIKEDKYGIISSSGYVSYCDSGKYSTCS